MLYICRPKAPRPSLLLLLSVGSQSTDDEDDVYSQQTILLRQGHECAVCWHTNSSGAVYRQEAAPVEPPAAKSSFNGLLFKQSRRGDVLIVSRTLAARMASPHTLQLAHLKLSTCCLIEGMGIGNCLGPVVSCWLLYDHSCWQFVWSEAADMLPCCMILAGDVLPDAETWHRQAAAVRCCSSAFQLAGASLAKGWAF